MTCSPCLFCHLRDESKLVADSYNLIPECEACEERQAISEYFFYQDRHHRVDSFEEHKIL